MDACENEQWSREGCLLGSSLLGRTFSQLQRFLVRLNYLFKPPTCAGYIQIRDKLGNDVFLSRDRMVVSLRLLHFAFIITT